MSCLASWIKSGAHSHSSHPSLGQLVLGGGNISHPPHTGTGPLVARSLATAVVVGVGSSGAPPWIFVLGPGISKTALRDQTLKLKFSQSSALLYLTDRIQGKKM